MNRKNMVRRTPILGGVNLTLFMHIEKKDNKLNNIPTYRSIHTLFAIYNNMLFYDYYSVFFLFILVRVVSSFPKFKFLFNRKQKKNNNEYLIKGLD